MFGILVWSMGYGVLGVEKGVLVYDTACLWLFVII